MAVTPTGIAADTASPPRPTSGASGISVERTGRSLCESESGLNCFAGVVGRGSAGRPAPGRMRIRERRHRPERSRASPGPARARPWNPPPAARVPAWATAGCAVSGPIRWWSWSGRPPSPPSGRRRRSRRVNTRYCRHGAGQDPYRRSRAGRRRDRQHGMRRALNDAGLAVPGQHELSPRVLDAQGQRRRILRRGKQRAAAAMQDARVDKQQHESHKPGRRGHRQARHFQTAANRGWTAQQRRFHIRRRRSGHTFGAWFSRVGAAATGSGVFSGALSGACTSTKEG